MNERQIAKHLTLINIEYIFIKLCCQKVFHESIVFTFDGDTKSKG